MLHVIFEEENKIYVITIFGLIKDHGDIYDLFSNPHSSYYLS